MPGLFLELGSSNENFASALHGSAYFDAGCICNLHHCCKVTWVMHVIRLHLQRQSESYMWWPC